MAIPRDPDARKYYRVGIQRMGEAQIINTKAELPSAAEYIGGYAVECILKALVLIITPRNQRVHSGGSTIEWMKKEFGHDLQKLREALRKRGAAMPRQIAGEFLYVVTWDPELRYEPGPGDPERAERFLSAAHEIVKWASGRI